MWIDESCSPHSQSVELFIANQADICGLSTPQNHASSPIIGCAVGIIKKAPFGYGHRISPKSSTATSSPYET